MNPDVSRAVPIRSHRLEICSGAAASPSEQRGVEIVSRNSLAKIVICLLLAARFGWADTPPGGQETPQQLKHFSLEQLGNVEVTTVSKEPEPVWKTPAAVFVLTQEDIRRSGAASVPEVLRLVPGVEVARVDSDHWSIAIRGFAGQFSKSLLVLIDGRSVYTQLFSGVYWDIQNLILEDVERIEVIRGPGGTIWGANAVNGVINIITKSANDTKGTLATLGGGNVNQGTGAARYGGSGGKDFNYRVYGMGFIRGPEFHSDGNGFDDWRIGQMGFRADWKKGDQDTFTVQGDIYRGETGERGFHRHLLSACRDNARRLRIRFRRRYRGPLAAQDGGWLRYPDSGLL